MPTGPCTLLTSWRIFRAEAASGEITKVAAHSALEIELTEGTIEHEVHDSLVSGDHAVLLMHLRAGRRGHDDLDGQVVYVFHVRDGKLVELWTHPFDQDGFDEFWS